MPSHLCSKLVLLFLIHVTWGWVLAVDLHAADATAMQKLDRPKSYDSSNISPVEKRFREDTGQTAETKRVELDRSIRAGEAAKEKFTYRFDLSSWSDTERAHARVWLAVAAAGSLSTRGPLGLAFSQNGVGMETQLNYSYNLDGTMVLGADYSVADGEITLVVDRMGHTPGTVYSVHAIVYAPLKPVTGPR